MLIPLVMAAAMWAQESAPVEMNANEKAFQESMTGVVLKGFFTMKDGGELSQDQYVIDRISKVKEDLWRFEGRIKYGGKDLKMAMNFPVKWAGDTPVISVTNLGIPGSGVYTARVVIYKSDYAGTWSGGKVGGKMFGTIVKQSDLPAADAPKPSEPVKQ
jgi:hypothetical protein